MRKYPIIAAAGALGVSATAAAAGGVPLTAAQMDRITAGHAAVVAFAAAEASAGAAGGTASAEAVASVSTAGGVVTVEVSTSNGTAVVVIDEAAPPLAGENGALRQWIAELMEAGGHLMPNRGAGGHLMLNRGEALLLPGSE